jgi:DNA-binding response OmpR family regulator
VNSSVLDGKTILAVDDEPDVLTILRAEIEEAYPNCKFETAVTYEEAARLLGTEAYDLVILDIMGVRGFDLLEIAVGRRLKVAMLTAHALSSATLKQAMEKGASSYLPKDKLGEILPFLEDVLRHDHKTGWERLLAALDDYYTDKFEPDWKKKIGLP